MQMFPANVEEHVELWLLESLGELELLAMVGDHDDPEITGTWAERLDDKIEIC